MIKTLAIKPVRQSAPLNLSTAKTRSKLIIYTGNLKKCGPKERVKIDIAGKCDFIIRYD